MKNILTKSVDDEFRTSKEKIEKVLFPVKLDELYKNLLF